MMKVPTWIANRVCPIKKGFLMGRSGVKSGGISHWMVAAHSGSLGIHTTLQYHYNL